MTREEYEDIRRFAGELSSKRAVVPDGQLLDECQRRLDRLLAELADNFEEHPHVNEWTPVVEAQEQKALDDYVDDMAERYPRHPEPAHVEEVPSDQEPAKPAKSPHKKAVAHKRSMHR